MEGDALVVLDVVATEQEAEVICGLLRSAGTACLTRQTNVGAGASETVERVRVKYLGRAKQQANAALRRRWNLDK